MIRQLISQAVALKLWRKKKEITCVISFVFLVSFIITQLLLRKELVL